MVKILKKTRIITILRYKTENLKHIAVAAAVIQKGGLVAFPTETVYGLGANALDATAVRSIFIVKGRQCDNPIIVHVADQKQLKKIVIDIPITAKKLIKKFWPGPLTLVLKKKKNVPKDVTAGLNTVAVRMPANRIALALIKKAGVPIAAPSANLSGRPSPTNAKHVLDDLNGKIDYIIDSGKTHIGVESTVLDLTTSPPTLLRPGAISKEQIEKVICEIAVHKVLDSNVLKSPGMKYKHYAPKAKIVFYKSEKMQLAAKELVKKGKKIAILRFNKHPKEIAKNLFAYLRNWDKKGIDIILCEPLDKIKKEGIGLAVVDRLKRAAGG